MKVTFLEFTGRGGIFQYTSTYIRYLKKNNIASEIITSPGHENVQEGIKVISMEPYTGVKKCLFLFKKKLLSSPKKENAAASKVSGARSMNSFRGCRHLWEKIFKRVTADNTSIVHIQWIWDYYPFQIEYMQRMKSKGIKIFFTFHNSVPHDGISSEALSFYKSLPKVVSHFFCHSEYDKDTITSKYNISTDMITTLPMGNVVEIKSREKDLAKIPTFLFFGHIRPYKGLLPLLEQMALPSFAPKDFRFIITGKSSPDMKRKIEDELSRHPQRKNIDLIDGYLANEQIAELFQRAHFLVLPYLSATQSAVIPLSYYLHTPAIATPNGGLKEWIDDRSTGYISDNISKLIQELTHLPDIDDIAETMGDAAFEFYKQNLDWDKIITRYISYLN